MASRFDPSNPVAIMWGFFLVMITFMMVLVKMSLSLGIFGAFAGLGLFAKMMWFDKR